MSGASRGTRRGARVVALAVFGLAGLVTTVAVVEATDSSSVAARPFVAGGYDDKPHLRGLFGRIAVGGYLEAHATWQREDGVTGEAGFALKRWNLLASSRLRNRVQMWAEVEFEDGGEEIVLELAQLDFELRPAFNLRGGMLLVPVGRFNLAHDGPRNAFTDRPLLATDLLGSALSMPGLGLFGWLDTEGGSRTTYEIYGVNGYDDAVLLGSPSGTRLPAGRRNAEDNNASPAWTGRIAWSPSERHEVGLSGFTGAYNVFRVDGLEVDARRSVRIAALDARVTLFGVVCNGEVASIAVDVPGGLAGLFASRQGGFFLEASRPFGHRWFSGLPGSFLSAGARVEGVDFDRDLTGDSMTQITGGVHFHPSPESVFKFDYQRSRTRDRFDNAAEGAALQLSLTSYF